MTENNTEATEVTDDAAESESVPAFPGTGTERSQLPDQQVSESVPETFPRDYVEKLRDENAKYRQRAGESDSLSRRLHTELVRATGRLADPTDLPFDADHLADADNMVAAIDALLEAKPHLATRRPAGDIGQGNRGPASGGFSLLDTLKGLT